MTETSVCVILCRYADLTSRTPRPMAFYHDYFCPDGAVVTAAHTTTGQMSPMATSACQEPKYSTG
jgi:hypothetical protein